MLGVVETFGPREARVHVHGNARLTPVLRCVLVRRVLEEGWTVADAAAAFEISARTVFKWLARYRSEGIDGLRDRSSRPRRSPTRLAADRIDAILALRRLWFTAAQISQTLSMPLSTVSLVL